jgi:Holliday junction resolvase-like predicted endonuclease
MDLFEELVMGHLTHNGTTFVCPQFSIDGGWSYPDFVALDFEKRTVSVVEVTAAYWPEGLLNKVKQRDHQWLTKLKDQLRRTRVIDDSWNKFRVVLYIRESATKRFQKEFGTAEDVEIRTLETIAFPWNWEWASAKLKKETEEAGQREAIARHATHH